MKVVEEIAELLYESDGPGVFPWDKATGNERDYYLRVAEVIVDTVVSHLDRKNEDFGGALHAASEYLRTETEIARLRRSMV